MRDVLVDGEVLVADGRHTRLDEAAVRTRAAAVIERVWALAAERLDLEEAGCRRP